MTRAWTVHPPADDARPGLVLVPERFSWFAATLPPVWMLVNRLWWPLLGFAIFAMAAALLLPAGIAGFAGLSAQVLIGLHAQDLRRWKLARQGRPAAAVVLARDESAALLRALDGRPDWAAAEAGGRAA
ncbi:DUF2628 domain-containing protein [Pseudoroseomonas globiformis]|uniref:DUF2628 domain-containing protein n=1 Tax=Teichococcus globiformis TaxID=2307229 RepID=A0ABV7G1B5_9PROT